MEENLIDMDQEVTNIDCNFKSICTKLYDSIESRCPKISKSGSCKLSEDIKSNRINEYTIGLINKTYKLNRNEGVIECPRSSLNKIFINKCSLESCPFYSNKMAYNCFLIHQKIFFKDHETLPNKVFQIGTGLNKNDYNRMVTLSIYNARAYIILLKYISENLQGDVKLKFNSKKLKKIFNKKKYNICQLCNYSFTDKDSFKCKCIYDKKLRRRRINFNKKWKLAVEVSGNSFLKKYKSLKDIIDNDVDITSLRYVRSLLCKTTYNGFNFYDIPLGYIIKTYNRIFDDTEWKIAENLGLTEEQYEKAKFLFLE